MSAGTASALAVQPASLAIDRLSLAFGGLTVLSEISFTANRGELLALIGPNGAGKTSVLNCIGGIYHPSAGSIAMEGAPLAGLKPHAIARLGLARTFQHGELFQHLTVIENLLVGRHSRIRTSIWAEGFHTRGARRAAAEHRAAVESILEFVDLDRYRHRPVASLPFGLQKVIGFARALAMQPRVLLLDEPSAGLNREEREDLARHILRIRHELGITMIWVEHDMQMVADLADRLVVLTHGQFLTAGAPADVLADPRVIEAYLGKRR